MAKPKSCQWCMGTGMELDQREFGAEMRRKREKKGITAKDMSLRVGCSPAYVSELERGMKKWTIDLRDRFKRALMGKEASDARS